MTVMTMMKMMNLVASPAASEAAKDNEDSDQNLGRISIYSHPVEIFSYFSHPSDNLKDKSEKHRRLHAVVRAGQVLRGPVGPAAEHHDRTLETICNHPHR